MKIKISFELEMSPENLKDWANEYGLGMVEASSDATNHLGALIFEQVKTMQHVEQFATVKHFRVN